MKWKRMTCRVCRQLVRFHPTTLVVKDHNRPEGTLCPSSGTIVGHSYLTRRCSECGNHHARYDSKTGRWQPHDKPGTTEPCAAAGKPIHTGPPLGSDRQRPTKGRRSSKKRYDDRADSTSVRTISGGQPESNRRRF